MKYLNVIVTVIAVVFIGVILRVCFLESLLRNLNENIQLISSSNQALINANARLENEVVNLRKEISVIAKKLP